MALLINIDGGSRGNPGPAAAGILIRSEEGEPLFEAGFFLGRQTNNAAEYLALIRALELITSRPTQPPIIYCDSELLVKQIMGEYRVKSPNIIDLHERAQMLLLRVAPWQLKHVPREMNARADELANMALDAGQDVIVRGGQWHAPSGPSAAEQTASQSAAAVQRETPPRQVRVSCATLPQRATCPAAPWACEMSVGARLPAEMCVHAAHALVPTILAVQNTLPSEFAAVPTLTVRCTRQGCRAVFHLAPAATGNGH